MSCHTWVYKKIKSMSSSEIDKEIDCVIKERQNRFYMTVTKDKYIERMLKISKDSSVPLMSYSEVSKRYDNAIYENNKIINMLIEARKTHDSSVITEKNGFDVIDNEYLFLCCDFPFRSFIYTDKTFTDPEKLIDYLSNIDQSKVGYYLPFSKDDSWNSGLSYDLAERIREFFDKHGKDNLFIEFG